MHPWIDKTKKIIEIINCGGAEARYVGGCVRDSLINVPVKDVDIATTMLPEHLLQLLNKHKIKNIPTGLKHGTITAIINSAPVEITTLRRDTVCDGRHAKVSFTGSWVDDARRRDFTFNALYSDASYSIFDYFEGQKDLLNRELKFVGDPDERITEDYLRILRVFRFHTAICTKPLSDVILAACAKHAKNIKVLSGERIQAEMLKILCYPNTINTLIMMKQCSVLKEVILGEDFALDQINNNFAAYIRNPIAKLALIIRSSKNPKIFPEVLFGHWKISKKHYRELLRLVLFNGKIDKPKIFILDHGKEFFRDVLAVYLAENKITQEEYNNAICVMNNWYIPEFPVSGDDIVDLGIKPGKNVGFILGVLKSRWQENEFMLSKEELLKLVPTLRGFS